MKYKIRFYRHIDLFFIFIVCIGIFSYLINYVPTDIQAHIKFIQNINDGTVAYPPNFLFYVLVNLFSGFTSSTIVLHTAAIVILSLSSTAKYAISKNIIIELNDFGLNQSSSFKVIFIAIGLFFCFAIPDPASLLFLKKMYLGKIVPMVWHNSTTLLVFPFAILLFWKQLKAFSSIKNVSLRNILFLNVLVIINIVIKPSFIFCYLPVTFLFIIYNLRKRDLKWILINLTPLLTGAVLILLQYYLIYALNIGSFKKETSGIMLSWPFEVYTFWIPWWLIPFSFILSFAFPIGAIVLYKEILKYKPFVYALALTTFGLILSAFILESGPRMSHGNFTWQNVVCCFILFLSTISFITPKFMSDLPWSRKTKIVFGLFVLHIVSGISYIVKILVTNQYF